MVNPLVAAMIAYFVITILIAWWYGRGAGDGYVEFTLAGKDLSLIPFTMTYFATFVGGGLTMGIAQKAFLDGISAQWYAMTQGIAWITISLVIGYLYAFDVVSVPELLGRVFGASTKYFAALATVIGQIALTAGQTIGMATIISTVTEIPLNVAFWISTLVFVGITVWGGMNSVAWADTLHGSIIIVGMAAAIPIALANTGGVSAVANSLPTGHTDWFGVGLIQIGTWYLLYITVAGAQQHLLQRTWSAKDAVTAKRGVFLSGLAITGYGILTATAGLIAYAQGAGVDSSMAFAWTLQNTMHPVLGGILLAAAVGAVMSGADSMLLAGATTFVNDIYVPWRGGMETVSQAHLVRVTRVVILVFGVGAAVIALSGVEIVVIDNLGMGVMSVLFAGVLALFWQHTDRRAGFPGLLVGGAVFVVWRFLLGEPEFFGEGSVEAAVPGTLAALLTIAILSYTWFGSETFTVEEIRHAATRDMNRFTQRELMASDTDTDAPSSDD